VLSAVLAAVICLGCGGGETHPPTDQSPSPGAAPSAPAGPVIGVGRAFLLGLSEGATEHTPIPPEAHLRAAETVLGLRDPRRLSERQLEAVDAFSTVLRFGAVLAVFLVFPDRVGRLVLGVLGRPPAARRLLLAVAAGSAPPLLAWSLMGRGGREALQHTGVLAGGLGVIGLVMVLFDRTHRAAKSHSSGGSADALDVRAALIIGLVQCLSLVPGVGRASAALLGGLALGLNAVAAVELAALIAVPTVAVECISRLLAGEAALLREQVGPAAMVVGLGASMISAAAVLSALPSLLHRRGLEPFGWYRLALAALLLPWLGWQRM
jgi:undecaprenyl-diphosphatase